MRYSLLGLILALCSCLSWCQSTFSVGVSFTLPSVALLDIEPNKSNITLNVIAPTEAGNPIAVTATNNTKWLNFTSAVASSQTRRITARLASASPNGLNINLATAAYTGSGSGALGIRISPITLSTTEQAIINNIGGAFTGTGGNNGYNLTYSLQIANYALLRQGSSTISVIYTLVDN